ncbi:MAG: NPCBM/NEW2 domain-containing protein [Verrucomicrobiota bacterium]|nr:NPCBM/NEW2 domain-containing protein [Verrucomicrobiota bacterium]
MASQGVLCLSRAATVETFTGERYTGKLELDTALIVTPDDAPTLKLDYMHVRRAQFKDRPAPDEFPPGVVLRSGSRVAGQAGPLTDSVVRFEKTSWAVSGAEVAWIVYQPLPPALTAGLPKGQTGALLPGGDFYEGAIRGADTGSAKVNNLIFGLRTFDGRRKELLALIVRELRPPAVSYEIATADGSVYRVDAFDADKSGVTLRHPLFDGYRIDAKEVVEIRADPRHYRSLTALPPPRVALPLTRASATAFAIDKSLGGESLTVAGRSIARGFEATVDTTATWEVPAGMTMLVAQIAVPANVPPINKLVFRVYADGRSVFHSQPLSSKELPVPVRARLGAVRALSLRIEASFPSSATGSGIWIEPTLLRR